MASFDPHKPNVLLILSDDHGPWAMGCAGNSEIITPSLDRLAREGTRFENFFCVSPVCSPARASLMTGEIPSQHGVHDWIRDGNIGTNRIDYLEGKTLITDLATEAGYRCGLIGKWHLGSSDLPRKGFVKWFAHQSGMSSYEESPMVDETNLINCEGYLTEVLTEEALQFITRETEQSQPFWLNLNYTAPHYPWIDSHPSRYTDLYSNCNFESCPIENIHPWNAGGNPATDEGHSNRRESLIGYYAATTAMDMGIGHVIDLLEKLNLTKSTLVIFMSDNGMNCGHHGIWGKGNGTRPQNMYDTSVKVPCIFSQPGRISKNRLIPQLTSAYDFLPTIASYLNFPLIEKNNKPGQSFKELLLGTSELDRSPIFVFDEYGPVRMVRTLHWKYIHRDPDGPHELYHLEEDPDEKINLIDNSSVDQVKSYLHAELVSWFNLYVTPHLDGRKWGVTGAGQISKPQAGMQIENAFASIPIAALSKK